MDSSVWWLWYLLLWKVAIPAMRVLQEEPFPNTCGFSEGVTQPWGLSWVHSPAHDAVPLTMIHNAFSLTLPFVSLTMAQNMSIQEKQQE